MRLRSLALLAPVVLVLASCGGGTTDGEVDPTETVTEAAAASEYAEPTKEPVERTDLTVFIEEPEPLTVFVNDALVCTTHAEAADALARVPAPRVQLFDQDGELLATQEVAGPGPVLKETCSIFVKFLDVPVSESYEAVFYGEDGDGAPYEYEEEVEFDREKFDEGYTQGIKFKL